jgi:hypothetical protein
MESLNEFLASVRIKTGHRYGYDSLHEEVPYELYIRGYNLLVFWRIGYLEHKHEFAWALVKDRYVVKEWDQCPTLSDLFDIQKEVCCG